MELVGRLGGSQSFVTKVGTGVLRVDVVELHELCQALGVSLATIVRRYERAIKTR